MAQHVGQGLLHDAVGRRVDGVTDRARRAGHAQRHGHAGLLDLGDQRRQLAQPRLWHERAVAVVAEDADDAAQLGERRAGDVTDDRRRTRSAPAGSPGSSDCPASACRAMTLTWWAATSCSSRASRSRSSSTARSASARRSRSRSAARAAIRRVGPLGAHVVADQPGRRHREQGDEPVERGRRGGR